MVGNISFVILKFASKEQKESRASKRLGFPQMLSSHWVMLKERIRGILQRRAIEAENIKGYLKCLKIYAQAQKIVIV
ncbi:hypothetical protein HpCK38_14970 [Helicobacter pylori]